MTLTAFSVTDTDIVVAPQGETLSTTDYGMFRLDPSNRPVKIDHAIELAEKIEKKNLLRLFPIIVGTDMTVKDGQHRLEAAKMLDVPVYYIVSDDMSIDDVAGVTALVERWTPADYLHHYCSRGRPEYLKLFNFIQTYPFISVVRAAKLCTTENERGGVLNFRNGDYKCDDLEFAQKVAGACLDYKDAGVDFYGHSKFVDAVANMMANDKYSHRQMRDKMQYMSRRIVKCPDTATYIDMLNEVYNYKSRNRVEIKLISYNHPDYRPDKKLATNERRGIAA